MLEQSLRRLQTDHLDLWQVHGMSFENDSAPVDPSERGRGMNWMIVLRQNRFQPLSDDDAATARLGALKNTKKYDGTVGREQHDFPSSEELPAITVRA